MTNLQEAAKDAVEVRHASNLSEVAHSFLRAVQAVNQEADRLGESAYWRNNHPIIRLFVDKLASLCHMQEGAAMENYGRAELACRTLAHGDPVSNNEWMRSPLMTETKQMKEFDAYAVGICYASVCTSLSAEEATKKLNVFHPTGTSSQWELSEHSFATGEPNPCLCTDSPETHKHYLFSC